MGDIARVTEITARSETSFEDAIATGIERASETLRQISGAWIKEQKVEIEDGRIKQYHVDMLVTFVLDDSNDGLGGTTVASAQSSSGRGTARGSNGGLSEEPRTAVAPEQQVEGVPH